MSILATLGIDPDDLGWKDLALCQNVMTENFYSMYEASPSTKSSVDEMCAACPVRRDCLVEGLENKESGVWGGWYLNGAGGIDKLQTKHKTPEDWDELKELLLDDQSDMDA